MCTLYYSYRRSLGSKWDFEALFFGGGNTTTRDATRSNWIGLAGSGHQLACLLAGSFSYVLSKRIEIESLVSAPSNWRCLMLP